MRKIFFILLVFVVISMCYPLHVQAINLTYASDFYLYGDDLVDSGQYDKALQAYQTARSMDERFYNEHYGISYQIGWVLNKLGRYDEALKEFKIAEKYRPEWIDMAAIYYNEGCVLAKLGRNEEALKAFDSAGVYEYAAWQILYNKGIVLSRMGRYAEAVTAFDTSKKAYGTYLPLLGSYQETAATYEKNQGISQSAVDTQVPDPQATSSSLSIAPDKYDTETSVDLLMRKGIDYSSRYEYENALGVFNRILKIEPANYEAMFWKGITLANLGRYPESLTLFDQSITYLDYKRHENYYISAYYGKGWVLAKQGKYNDSIKAFDKIIIVNPDIFQVHHDMAWVLAKQGKYNEAIKEYNRSLDWETRYRIEAKSYSILGPLGTYQDVATAYDKTKSSHSFIEELSSSPSYDVVIYQNDFSTDPHWQTPLPRMYYWDQMNKSYHFQSEVGIGYGEIIVPYTDTAFRLEYDITIPHADPGALVRFGMSQYNTSQDSQQRNTRYNSQNAIMTEFKSWRSGTFREIKDGDKSFMPYTIDNRKYSSDPEYNGMCWINREDSIATPSFGSNRIYHVVTEFDPIWETVSTQVTDNLHEKTYYVCSYKWGKVGTFRGMNRLILVSETAENADFEGSIDNVVLSVPSTSIQTVSMKSATQTSLIQTPINSNENKPNPLNNIAPATTQSSPSLILPLSGFAIMGIIFALKKKNE